MLTGLILSGVLTAVPQLPPSTPVVASPRAPTVGSVLPAKPDPAFSRLFQVEQPKIKPRPQPQPQPPVRVQRPRTKVVCGMTLILVGPERDPEMPKPALKDDGIQYTMRRYPPPACGQDEKTDEKKR